MAKWPFSKVFGPGLVSGSVPTHDQLNQLDDQQSQAADGTVWTDVAAAANMQYLFGDTNANYWMNAAYREVSGEWFILGTPGGAVVKLGVAPYVGAESFLGLTVPAGNGYQAGVEAQLVCNPAGVLLVGGTPASGTTQKLRRSVDGGTWTVQDTVTGLGITSLGWFPAAGKFFAGYGSGNVIESSADGITWATITAPNSDPRGVIATSPTRMVWLATGSTTLLTSDDGVTFTSRSIGANKTWVGAAWNSVLQKWFITASDGTLYSSPDGATWTYAGDLRILTSLGTMTRLLTYGRVLYLVGVATDAISTEVWISVDGAVSWRRAARWLFNASSPPTQAAMGPGGQLCVLSRAGGQGRLGLRLGA